MSKVKYIVKSILVKPKPKPSSNPFERPAPLAAPFHCENKLATYNCKNCNFRTNLLVLLKQHIQQARTKPDNKNSSFREYNIQRYTCKKFSFETHSSLKWLQHIRRCFNDKQKMSHRLKLRIGKNWKGCDQCHFKTPYSNVLERHKIGKHLKEDEILWYQCDQCSYKSKLKCTLQRHVLIVHVEKVSLSEKCDQCNYITKRKSAMGKHNAAKHTRIVDVTCKQCPLQVTRERYRQTHMYKVQVFKCDQCLYESKHKSAVTGHKLLRHGTIRWYKCDQCPYQSKRRDAVKAHKNSRHSDNDRIAWYECDLCEFQAKSERYVENRVISWHLEGLLKDDNDVRCYKCDQCGYYSKHLSALQAHRISKHLKKADIQIPRSWIGREEIVLNDHTYAQRVKENI